MADATLRHVHALLEEIRNDGMPKHVSAGCAEVTRLPPKTTSSSSPSSVLTTPPASRTQGTSAAESHGAATGSMARWRRPQATSRCWMQSPTKSTSPASASSPPSRIRRGSRRNSEPSTSARLITARSSRSACGSTRTRRAGPSRADTSSRRRLPRIGFPRSPAGEQLQAAADLR